MIDRIGWWNIYFCFNVSLHSEPYAVLGPNRLCCGKFGQNFNIRGRRDIRQKCEVQFFLRCGDRELCHNQCLGTKPWPGQCSVQHRQREGGHIGHCGQCGQLAVIIPHIVLLLWLTLLGGKI